MKPLAITGLGVVSPIGVGRNAFRAALEDPARAKQTAFGGPSQLLTGPQFAEAKVAELRDFDPAAFLGDKGLRNFDRMTRALIVAAKLGLEDAGIKRDGAFVAAPAERVGLCAATAYGSLDSITEINRVAELEHPRYLNPSRFPNTVINSAAGYVSIWEGLEGPNVTVVDGNCGGLDAVLTAEMHLACGRADILLVGGAEILSEALYLAFQKLGILSEGEHLCQPGEVVSRGMHLGEGAALLALETAEHARARKASVLAEVVGYGTAFEPPAARAQLVHAADRAVERAVRAALRDAELAPSEIDLVACAESGVSRIDMAEEEGLARVLGPDVATVAPKGIWGEMFGASGAFALAGATLWIDGLAAPLIRGQAPREIRNVLITSLGYYGNVSAVVLRKPRAARGPARAQSQEASHS